jgi:hypothetical protein
MIVGSGIFRASCSDLAPLDLFDRALSFRVRRRGGVGPDSSSAG